MINLETHSSVMAIQFIWQTTLLLALGLSASWLTRRKPVRAHQTLVVTIIACLVTPAAGHLMRKNHWYIPIIEKTNLVRIPMSSDTQSGFRRTPYPIHIGHFSERSDAGGSCVS